MVNYGIVIMVVGMLVVFAFLAIMVISMRFMSGIILKYFPELEESAVGDNGIMSENETEMVVAIAVAYIQN